MSSEASLVALKTLCDSPAKAQDITNWLYQTTDSLVELEEKRHLDVVADVLQARILAVAIKLAEQLDNAGKSRCLDQWERVTFRIFGFSRKDARTKVGEYVRLARKILRKEEGVENCEKILVALKELGADYPIENVLATGLAGKNCYEGFEAECRYILWRYEESLAQKDGAQVNEELRATIWRARTPAETIEHILPQKPNGVKAWSGKLNSGERLENHVHSIGNLLLLPNALNGEASRKQFSDKKNVYAKSEGLRIVKEVTEKTDWDQNQIEERESRIIEWAKKAWGDLG